MRHVVLSKAAPGVALIAAVLLIVTQAVGGPLGRAATALVMGGAGHPLSVPPDSQEFVNGYLDGANKSPFKVLCSGGAQGCSTVAVVTNEDFFPLHGSDTFDVAAAESLVNLHRCLTGGACTLTRVPPDADPGTVTTPLATDTFLVVGYSESATVATLEKRALAATPNPPETTFVLLGSANRPNGGVLQSFAGLHVPVLDLTFSGATPTDTDFPTVDLVRQYDFVSDFPTNPLNLLSLANAAIGFSYLHGDYTNPTPLLLQGRYGDTTYYLATTRRLPLLMPLATFIPDPILAVLDAPLRVLVEAGYNRTINPGEPTRADFTYVGNPLKTAADFLAAIPTGLDDGIEELLGTRPLRTTPAGPYGVGGPPVNAGSTNVTVAPDPLPGTETPGAATTTRAVPFEATAGEARDDATETVDPPVQHPATTGRQARPRVRGPIGASDSPATGVPTAAAHRSSGLGSARRPHPTPAATGDNVADGAAQ